MQPATAVPTSRDLVPLVTVDGASTRALTVSGKPLDAFGTRLTYERVAETYAKLSTELASLAAQAGPRAQGSQLALWTKKNDVNSNVSGPFTVGGVIGVVGTGIAVLVGAGTVVTCGAGVLAAGAVAAAIYASNSAAISMRSAAKGKKRRLTLGQAKPLIKALRDLDAPARAALREPVLDMLGDKYRSVLNVEAQSDIYNLFNASSVQADPMEARAAAFAHFLASDGTWEAMNDIAIGASNDEIKVMRTHLKDAGFATKNAFADMLAKMRDGAAS